MSDAGDGEAMITEVCGMTELACGELAELP
jgi:hypothetical protein